MATLPDEPSSSDDLDAAVLWASCYFGIATALDLGLDAGQMVLLRTVARALDQLQRELAAQDAAHGWRDL